MKFKKLQYISILLIENNKNISNKIIDSYKNIFENIYVTKDSQEAFEVYKINEKNIDIVIVDIEEKRDIYAIKDIRKIGNNTPILVFVHPNEASLLIDLFDYEINTFMVKPISTYKLLRKINKLAEMIIYKNELKAKEKIIDENLIYSQTNTRGVITYVSKPFVEISGYTKEELVGKSHNTIKHKDMEASIFKDLWKTIKSGNPWSGEIKNLKKDGGHYTVKSVVSPIYNKNKIIGYGSARLDITQLKENSKQLHFYSKYKAMNEMLSMVSHHWRQPIASIGLEADNALFDIAMDELNRESIVNSLSHINEQVKYLSSTLDTFKSFLQNSSKQIIAADKLLKNIVFVVEGLLKEHNITLNIRNYLENRNLFTISK